MAEPSKTLRELIALGDRYLAEKGIPESRTVIELLAARLFSCGRMDLFRHAGEVPSGHRVDALRRGMLRVAKGEPVQYVLGQWEFRGLTLKVDRRALIPRPETERLVDHVLASPAAKAERPLVVDVGTGTGCILLSLAQEMPAGVFIGLDISPEALALARENAALTGLAGRVHFAGADGWDAFDPCSVDILVSNPPYIPSATVDALPPWIREHEPRIALDGGPDGLDVYRSLVGDASMVLKTGGGLFLEIGDDQGPALADLLEEYGFAEIQILKDYAGKDRYALARQSAV